MANSKYGWIITRSCLEEEDVQVVGPHNISDEIVHQLQAGEGEEFHILDGDLELCYVGRIYGDYDGFEPVDDYAADNDGCTTMLYKDSDGVWTEL